MFRRKLKDFAEMQKEQQESVSLLDRFKKGAGEKSKSSPSRIEHPEEEEKQLINNSRQRP
jgi:hypothetical protein